MHFTTKLDKQNIENILALTPMQEGILFHYLKTPKSNQYFEQLNLYISGEIDRHYFEKAWNLIIKANEMLRTKFLWEKLEKPSQIILKEHECEMDFYDLSAKDSDHKKPAIDEIKTKDKDKGFNLTQVPFRVILCKLAEKKYEMFISNHHILYDGWSNGIILKEFFKVYHELCNGSQSIKLPLKPSIKEFIKWIQSRDRKKQEQFWKEYLIDFEMQTGLPIKRKIGETKSVEDSSIILEENFKNKIDIFIKDNRVTLASVFYSAWGILLQKYCHSEDVTFGTTISGRSARIKGIEDMVGLFINTVPLRVQVAPCVKMVDIVSDIENILQVREEFECTPLTDIATYITHGGNESLFNTIVAIENYPLDNRLLPENSLLSIDSYSSAEMTHYDLTVCIMLFNNIEIKISYKQELFEQKTIEYLIRHLKEIIRNIIENPQAAYSQLEIISQEEKQRILYVFNDTTAEYPAGKTIQQLFAEQTKKSPDLIALVGTERGKGEKSATSLQIQISYRHLHEQSDKLAGFLIEKGVLAGDIVGIIIERSPGMITGILGILKAGGAYLPVESDFPQERIDYMLKDSGAKVMIGRAEKTFASSLPRFLASDSSNPASDSSNLAYLIYTSGSTGTPKGVLIEHRSVIRLIKNTNYIEFLEGDRILQSGAISFDASTFEIWGALLNGSLLVIMPKEHLLNPFLLKKTMYILDISILWLTSPLFNQMIDEDEDIFARLRCLLVGGDTLSPIHINRVWQKFPGLHINNGYGPTENTTFSTTFRIDREYTENIPIGMPIANSTAYIVDKYGHLSPIGVPGELYVGGDGIARGYLNQPELTTEKFKYNKFYRSNRTYILYKTGDLCQWLPDGNIEFLGRIDQQVKIRGFRIEPDEIVKRLLKHKEIKDAVVITVENKSNDKYLAAYFVSNKELSDTELSAYLLKVLPDYMIPSFFIRLEKIPLTFNGKIDRNGLPAPKIKQIKVYEPPRNEIEKELVEIWGRVLGKGKEKPLNQIGIDDNFFRLGGHSLKAISLLSLIHKTFNVKIPLEEIFKRPTIRQLFNYINNAVKEQYTLIEPVEKKEYYTLSPAQKRLYFLQQMDNVGTTYNISAAWVLEGAFDSSRFEYTFMQLVKRHESLRTSFIIVDEEPAQRIHDEVEHCNLSTDYTDCTDEKENILHHSAFIIQHFIHSFIRPFDLSKAPLLRVGLVKLEVDRQLFLVDMHHIISDGISTQVLVQDFSALYAGKELAEVKLQYKDYAEWQNREKASKRCLEQREYWKKEYEGDIPILELPIDKTRSTVQNFEGETVKAEMGAETTEALKAFALETDTTLFILLLGLYNVFLAKITDQEDIIVGTPTAGRRHTDLEKIIGMFVNTLALRNNPLREKKFIDFLKELKEIVLKGFENQEYQYEDLLEQIPVNRGAGRNPLFNTMFVLQETGSYKIEIPNLKFITYEFDNKTSKFDLTLIGVEVEDKLSFIFEYRTQLFKPETIERFMIYFKNLITGIIANRNRSIGDLEILTEKEKNRILFAFNDTEQEYPKDKTIHQLFTEQASRTPDNIALVGETSIQPSLLVQPVQPVQRVCPISLSYRQLNDQSDRLAGWLIEKGVLADSIVGIMMERSLEMIISIMGILKAGGAYLPIDPEYPQERIDYMLKDSGAKLLAIASGLEGEKVRRWEGEKVFLGETLKSLKISSYPLTFLPSYLLNSSNLAYIIYTSGSTGKPKGVAVEHRGVVNYICWAAKTYIKGEKVNFPFYTSIAFDLTVTSIFTPLITGNSIFIYGDDETFFSLEKIIDDNRVEVIKLTPSHLKLIKDKVINIGSVIKRFIVGGEELDTHLAERISRIFNGDLEIYNEYGPTETVVGSMIYKFVPGENDRKTVLIGGPVDNTQLYILDKNQEVAPIGIPGEIYIAGDGVARGYLNRPALTFEKFIKNPFGSTRMYRTGDLGSWLPDGNIEFLGRVDLQVKIRGFRVETAEIEIILLRNENIKQVVVTTKEDNHGDKYLCAYYTADKALNASLLKDGLSGELPGYMIPSCFIQVDKIFLTPNGKINMNALPAPEFKAENNYAAPRDQIEVKLVKIWCRILANDNKILSNAVGIDDNFFQLGGHSLKAAAMASRVHKEFKVKLPLEEIFKRPTVRGLAEFIKQAGSSVFIPVEAVPCRDYYTLSAAQKRLFILYRMNENSTVYNMPVILSLEGIVGVSQFEAVIKKLIERHESFRTSFEMIGEEAVQRVHNNVLFEIEYKDSSTDYIDYNDYPDAKGGNIHHFIQSFIRPFDFSKAPLLRVSLLKQEADKHLLMVDMHHIISDGMSMGIFVKEFMALYAYNDLPVLRVQYKDYAEWQQRGEVKEIFKGQEKYWLEQFEGGIPVLNLPTDYVRPSVQSFEGRSIIFEMGPLETAQLKKCALDHNTTLYMILLTAFGIFLSKLSGQEDIVIGTPTAGRRHADLEPVIGMFVNTLALRYWPIGEKNITEYLEEVTGCTLKAFENQDHPLEDLVEKVVLDRDMGRNPLFDVMFVLQNTEISEIQIPGLKLTPYPYERKTAKFDIILSGNEKEDKLEFDLEYGTKLFNESTIERFIGFFKKIISIVPGNCGMRLSEIEIISDEEKKQILEDFNDTGRDYPADKTLCQLFSGQAEQNPDRIALIGRSVGPVSLTYRELNEQSDRLGNLLIEKCVITGDIIGIMMERTIDLIIGILGILKAGCAYMPIDPEYPQERIDYMLKDAAVNFLLISNEIGSISIECVFNFQHSAFSIQHSNHLAYIMYTSGSTGQPKGVIVSHRNVVRLVKNTNFLLLNEETRILQTSTPVFDPITIEIWGSLLNGGQLVLVDKGTILDTHRLAGALQKNHINTLWLSSPLFNQLIQQSTELFSPLKYLLVGGDVLSAVHINRVKRQFPRLNVINGYGPTENTTFSTTYLIEKEFKHNIPIGRPIANSTAYIYDKNDRLTPIGVIGELYVGGDGVALGYLNKPELTAEKFSLKFIRFNRSNRSYGTYVLFYKTGDLVRWMADGNIEFFGRIDHQIKIRGFRVELGEIENRLLSYAKVKEALVIAGESEIGEDKYICAYVVPAAPYTVDTLDVSELREYLGTGLPSYMMPTYFMLLEKLPLNVNGKVDRHALPKPTVESSQSYMPPRNEIEEKLANIWLKLLKINKISIHDNFFEIGGHSLKVLHLVNAIQKEFNVKLDFQEIFLSPTIAGLYTLIQGKNKTSFNQIEIQPQREYYELSYSQKRLWMLQQFEPHSSVFNLSSSITLHESVDQAVVEKALAQMIARHEAFRTYFKIIAGQPVQIIESNALINLEFIDLTGLNDYKHKEKREYHTVWEDNEPFNLEKPPLFRIKLIKYKEMEFDLILTMHHIISDGWSMEILGQEFTLFYEAYKMGKVYSPEPLKIQYKDFAYWHNRLTADKEKMQEARKFWEKQLQGDYTILDLPYDFPRTNLKTKESAAYGLVIPGEIMLNLKKIAIEYKGSLFMLLLTCFTLLLNRITGQEDIILAIPGAARQHDDLKNIVGFFVNTLILKDKINPDESLIHYLLRVQNNTYELLQYQDFPVELICSEYKIKYPEISIFFNMSIFGNTTQENINEKHSYHIPNVQDAKFDMVCYLEEYKNGIRIGIHYFKELFKPVTIEKIMQLYRVLLEDVALNPGKKVGEYRCNLNRPKNKLTIPSRLYDK